VGVVGMRSVVACSGIGSRTRRWGSATGHNLAKEREEMGRERKRGAPVLTGINGVEQGRGVVRPGVAPHGEEVGEGCEGGPTWRSGGNGLSRRARVRVWCGRSRAPMTDRWALATA
jgi:hypothetical protein